MTQSNALSHTLRILRRTGISSFTRTDFTLSLSCYQSFSYASNPFLAPSDPGSTSSSKFASKDVHFCISFSSCFYKPFILQRDGRRSSVLMFLPTREFSSAQPMPAKQAEDKEERPLATAEKSRMVSASALDVDRALEDYDKILEKHRQYYISREQSQAKLKALFTKVIRVISMTWNFLCSIPVMTWKAIVAPWNEKRKWIRMQWKHLKEGAHHYWVGTKLLAMDIRVASRLFLKVLKGIELTRREKRQLSRTVADLFRMVPMVIFLVVPFLEFLLPVAISLFPNMLPSTFEDKLKKEEQLKKRLNAKLEVARFLQDTVAVMAQDLKKRETGDTKSSADDLYQFMKDIRRGSVVHNEDIIRFAQLFGDEFTLDNLERVHLTSMCQLVGLSPFGTDNFLRTRLRAHLGGLKRDDAAIREEGLDTMTTDELRQACRARAIRALYGDGAREYMKQSLAEWLELSLDRKLPSSLLLLSRAFTVTQPIKERRKTDLSTLAQTLSTLPDDAVEEVQLEVLADDTRVENEKKLEYLKREEERIREEESEMRTLQTEPGASESKRAVSAQDMAATATAAALLQTAEAQVLKDAIQSAPEASAEEISAKLASNREQKLKQVLSALAVLTSSSGVTIERSKFMELVQKEIDRISGEMTQKGGASLRFSNRGLEAWRPAELPTLPEASVSKRLQDRVAKLMHNIEAEMDKIDEQIGTNMQICDLDGDGMISQEELEVALGYLREQLGGPELKHLLEELCRAAQKDSRIDVNALMELANKRFDASNT